MYVKKRELTFDDIPDLYFTEIKENRYKDHDDIEPFYDNQEATVDSEVVETQEIKEIYDLIKSDSKTEDILTEENKKEYIERYGDEDNSGDDEPLDSRDVSVTDTPVSDTNTSLSSPYKMRSAAARADSPTKTAPVSEDSKVDNKDEIKFNIDENHFGPIGIDLKSEPNGEVTLEEEEKHAADEVENEQFDQTIKPYEQGATPRSERMSHIVQELSIEDFEMIRFLGDGSYGKVNLVK